MNPGAFGAGTGDGRGGGIGLLVLAALVVLLAGLVLSALPRGLDGDQARLCRAALPALEPDGLIEVRRVLTDPLAPHGIRIDYRIEKGSRVRGGVVRCAFGGGRLDRDRLRLVGIEVGGNRLGEAQLFMLERFWLKDPQALRSGERRLTGLLGLVPLVPVELSRSNGYLVQQVLNGLPTGASYAFLASAFALIYGLTNRINLAFGHMAVAGSYAAASMITGFGPGLASASTGGIALAIGLALLAALLHGTILGSVVGRAVMLPLLRMPPRSFLIASIGLAIALLETVRLLAGARDRWIQPILNDPVQIFGGDFPVMLTAVQLLEVAAAAAVLVLLVGVMRFSRYGRAWRATSDDPLMAALLGVDTARLAVATLAVAAGLAGLAGGLSALHFGQATYAAGMMLSLKALLAAVLGGIGSLPGAALGGLIIGIGESLWAAYWPGEWRDGAILAGLVLLLVFRPDGLLGRSRPARDGADGRWLGRL